MSLLATDFGASAAIGLMVLSAWVVVLLIVICGVWYAGRLLRSGSPTNQKTWPLLLLITLLPLFCCVAPPLHMRIAYGRFPLTPNADNQVHEGMTMDEVLDRLGPPHDRHELDGRQLWYYWTDSFTINFVCIHFGPDGRVTGKHI